MIWLKLSREGCCTKFKFLKYNGDGSITLDTLVKVLDYISKETGEVVLKLRP